MLNSTAHYKIRNMFLFCFAFFADFQTIILDARLLYMRHGKRRINSFLAKKIDFLYTFLHIVSLILIIGTVLF